MPWRVTPAPSDRELLRRFLGFSMSDVALNVIQQRMGYVESVGGEDAIVTVQQMLDELVKINNKLNSTRDVAGVADEAIADEDTPTDKSYYRGEQMKTLRDEGKRLVREVSETMSLSVYRHVFDVSQSTSLTVRG